MKSEGKTSVQLINEPATPPQRATESKVGFAVLLDHAPVMVMLVDRERHVRRINRAAATFTGRPVEEMIGLRGGEALRCLHALDNPKGCGFGPFCTSCQIRLTVIDTFETGNSHQQVVARLPIARGEVQEERELLVSTTLLGDQRVVVYFEDITAHKEAEDELKTAQEYAQHLIDSSLNMIISVDQDRRIVEFNPAAQETFGYTKEEILDQPVDLLYADPGQGVEINRTVQEGGCFSGEIANRRKNGQTFPAVLSASAVRDSNGNLVGIMGISQDITARTRTEKTLRQMQRLELIGQLAAGVAHEINNPLTLVIGYATLLLKRELDPDVRQRLETICQGGRRAAAITERLLTFARRQQIVRHPQELNAVVRETLELVRYSFEVNHVQLIEELAKDVPWVDIHAGQIQQVLLSLLQNSQDAVLSVKPEGVVRVRTRTREGWVFLEVEDDGPGIPAAIQERMFDPFFTTKEVGKGTGLGLSMGLGVAQDHGGHLRTEPRSSGACMVLELPVSTPSSQSIDPLSSGGAEEDTG